MPDDLDMTEERISFELSVAIKNAAQKPRETQPTGYCKFCEEPVEQPKLFCCIECSKDWDKRRSLRG